MKKTVAIIFAVLFAVSCFAVIGFAGDDQTVETNVEFSIPDFIEHHVSTKETCPYCGKVCADSAAYASHLEGCSAYAEYLVADAKNTCYWCGKEFTSEAAYNKHMADYVAAKDHIATCPNTGDYYVDGGCGATFKTKAEYDAHVAQCPCEGKYTTEGKINYYVNLVKDVLINAVKNANWGEVLNSVVSLFKALFAGVDIGL